MNEKLAFVGLNWSKERANHVHKLVRYAQRVGRLRHPGHCQQCGYPATVWRKSGKLALRGGLAPHHEDYMRPYHVVWLCQSCHYARHMTAGDFLWSAEAMEALRVPDPEVHF